MVIVGCMAPPFNLLPSHNSRPITIVVPFAAGGATDAIGRAVAERMKSSLGQPVIVENVTGAAGTTTRAFSAEQASI
jgi:tripartite-type tricarboxylate transporter receptor subunit TctC